MSDNPTTIDQLQASQPQKEVVANSLFAAASPAMVFARKASTSAGLTWGYYGGRAPIAGAPVAIADGTVTLTASDTNYIYAEPDPGSPASWDVIVTTSIPSGWPGPLADDALALYEVVVGASTATSWDDLRASGGAAGAAGPTGPAGATGPTGPTGPAGVAQGWMWGDGSDGSLLFDGSNAVTGFTRSGSVYTATRNIMATDAQIDPGVSVVMAGHFMAGNGTLSGSGTIGNPGGDASGSTQGAQAAGAFYSASQAGVAGTSGSANNGVGPSNSVLGLGGVGGANSVAQAGGAAGTPTVPTAANGGVAYLYSVPGFFSCMTPGAVKYTCGGSGGSGRGNTGVSGGSGGSGGIVGIFFKTWTFTGTVNCKGGNGGNGTTTSGGGAGSAGGMVLCCTQTANWQSLCTVNVSGGTGGTGAGGGTSGTNGAVGRIVEFII